MEPTDSLEVLFERLPHCVGQHHSPILLPFPPPHRDLPSLEVEILHPQLEALLQPEPGTIEQRCHDPRNIRTFVRGRSRGGISRRRSMVRGPSTRPGRRVLRRRRLHHRPDRYAARCRIARATDACGSARCDDVRFRPSRITSCTFRSTARLESSPSLTTGEDPGTGKRA